MSGRAYAVETGMKKASCEHGEAYTSAQHQPLRIWRGVDERGFKEDESATVTTRTITDIDNRTAFFWIHKRPFRAIRR